MKRMPDLVRKYLLLEYPSQNEIVISMLVKFGFGDCIQLEKSCRVLTCTFIEQRFIR